jgi:two-component system nitrogen regulation response regulator GlnG
MASVLVIDEDASHHALVVSVARSLGLGIDSIAADEVDIHKVDRSRTAIALLFDRWPAATSLIERLAHGKIPVIAVAARPAGAIEAMRAGACEVLFKPLSAEELRAALGGALEGSLQAQGALAVRDTSELSGAESDLLVGRSPVMLKLYKTIGLAAAHDVPLMIVGETGTGKRTIARAVHQHSNRKDDPLSILACLADTHFEAVAGPAKARGAKGSRRSGSATPLPCLGTCVLAGVDQLSTLAQQQLLRLLEQNRPGDRQRDSSRTGMPRVIATAGAAAARPQASSKLLAELRYELGRCIIIAPPLRERLEDLPLLAEHFLRIWSRRLGKRVYQIAPAAIELLKSHTWPGNLRELDSVFCQAVVCAKGSVLTAEDMIQLVHVAAPAGMRDDATVDWRRFVEDQWADSGETLYASAIEVMDQRLLKLVLERTGGNQARAARALGMTRARLRQKLRERGIVIDRQIDVYEQPVLPAISAARPGGGSAPTY